MKQLNKSKQELNSSQVNTELNKFITNEVDNSVKAYVNDFVSHTQKPLYTSKQVEERLGVSRTTLYRWRKIGYLKYVQIGGSVRYREQDIASLLA